MAAILLEPPTAPPNPATMPNQDDHEAHDMSCPMCGSGSTYQTQDGRWGCVSCGSSWS